MLTVPATLCLTASAVSGSGSVLKWCHHPKPPSQWLMTSLLALSHGAVLGHMWDIDCALHQDRGRLWLYQVFCAHIVPIFRVSASCLTFSRWSLAVRPTSSKDVIPVCFPLGLGTHCCCSEQQGLLNGKLGNTLRQGNQRNDGWFRPGQSQETETAG